MRRFFRFSTPLVVLVLFAVPSLVVAQTAQVGTIAGQVKDESGGVLPGVAVAATSQERGFTRNATTDANGRFLFPSMPLGRYRVVATLQGFETMTRTDNLVESEKTTELTITLRLAGQAAEVTVTGEVPIVDKTNTSVNTRLREKEFQKMPVGRSYQNLIGAAPGVIGTGNVNAHGALSSNNQFLFDGVDTTDPTTGTFGGNLNFEAIQEVSIYTAGISAEYGRAVGAVVNVITKSGTNRFEGSGKYIATNDDWNAQNKTKNQVTGASLERVKFDKVNPVWSFTLGGPIWPDHAWFFGAYENAKSISPERQTVVVPENFQQSLKSPFWDVRLTGQITPSHTIWGKYHESPTNGFVIDYWPSSSSQIPVLAGELEALTSQDQTSDSYAGQWTGVFGSNISAEAMYADNHETITVVPFQHSTLDNGAPHENEADGFFYNGATFDGFVKRPRKQATFAGSYFTDIAGNSHSFKAGFDWQHLESSALFAYPNNQYFFDHNFDPATRTVDPFQRYDFDPPEASTSKGNIYSVYLRDKFEVGKRLFFEIGARYENQKGESDIGETTVDAQTIAPRFAGAFDLSGDGKTLINATYGRFYQFILQGFSDSFANIPQEGNYSVFEWDGTQYVFSDRVESGANALQRNTGLDPTYTDEVTVGFQRQLGNTIGLGVRGIYRKWGDLIDDIRRFSDDPSGPTREFVNYGPAKRKYTAIEFTFEKRFSQNWNASANYTYSKTTGNHFANSSSTLGDFLEGNCTTSVDPTVGTLPCSVVNDGPNKNGRPSYDRPHDVKLGGAYTLPLGLVNLTLGVGGEWISGIPYEKQRAVNQLNPRTGTSSGTTTYFYNSRGSDRLDPYYTLDTSLEATVRLWLVELGVKGEVFNVTDQQEQSNVNNVVFCGNASASPTSSCGLARARYGTATARGAFQAPRTYRLTTLIRF